MSDFSRTPQIYPVYFDPIVLDAFAIIMLEYSMLAHEHMNIIIKGLVAANSGF